MPVKFELSVLMLLDPVYRLDKVPDSNVLTFRLIECCYDHNND